MNPSILISLDRESRRAVVEERVSAAFDDWHHEKPQPSKLMRSPSEKPASSMVNATYWRDVPDECLLELYPQFLTKESWLWLLPALLLCDSSDESIGKHPISLGMPPQPDHEIEVISIDELEGLFTQAQLEAICLFTEMWHWLAESEIPYSHWKEFWYRHTTRTAL